MSLMDRGQTKKKIRIKCAWKKFLPYQLWPYQSKNFEKNDFVLSVHRTAALGRGQCPIDTYVPGPPKTCLGPPFFFARLFSFPCTLIVSWCLEEFRSALVREVESCVNRKINSQRGSECKEICPKLHDVIRSYLGNTKV
jgi:hypothetical protein